MKKRKHHQAIHAFADWWEIEVYSEGEWKKIDFPSFDPILEYRIVPNKDGWLPWYGGECPVDGATLIKYITFEKDYIAFGPIDAGSLYWGQGGPRQIALYRVVRIAGPDPYTELKAAAADTVAPTMPAKKTRKVKLLAWFGADHVLRHVEEGFITTDGPYRDVSRVPSEDKEIEVEE